MRLYPANCCLKVQAEKFIGFILTRRGIEFNLEKCQAVIDMRIPTSMEEVHQLIGRLVALSRFLSCAGDIAFLYFVALRKK